MLILITALLSQLCAPVDARPAAAAPESRVFFYALPSGVDPEDSLHSVALTVPAAGIGD